MEARFARVLEVLDKNGNGQIDNKYTVVKWDSTGGHATKVADRVSVLGRDDYDSRSVVAYDEKGNIDELKTYLESIVPTALVPPHLEQNLRAALARDLGINISGAEWEKLRTRTQSISYLMMNSIEEYILEWLKPVAPGFSTKAEWIRAWSRKP